MSAAASRAAALCQALYDRVLNDSRQSGAVGGGASACVSAVGRLVLLGTRCWVLVSKAGTLFFDFL